LASDLTSPPAAPLLNKERSINGIFRESTVQHRLGSSPCQGEARWGFSDRTKLQFSTWTRFRQTSGISIRTAPEYPSERTDKPYPIAQTGRCLRVGEMIEIGNQ